MADDVVDAETIAALKDGSEGHGPGNTDRTKAEWDSAMRSLNMM
jgi:hypothetical protein